ncbi:MAG: endonuclease/exonuclease/phosphatase family protein [Spirochaetaceae bacterium]|jgi:endonuclease/exonuclease/phosphatase family metal-dependent hydrolase|nr:endonuclease/exonuclease/phosphatase family protein [Spirochaetaceae bacterium]
MKKNYLLALTALTLPLFFSCFGSCGTYTGAEVPVKNQTLSVASWNVQALFDGNDDGIEYEEYRHSSGWNAEKYEARLMAVSDGVNRMRENGPDVTVFIELENGAILDTLAGDYLKKSNYRYSFFAGNPGYSLGTGVLSRYKISKTLTHSSDKRGVVLPRPIAEVWIEAGGSQVALFVCHWKSKLGGEEETEKLRREAANVILRRYGEIRAAGIDTPVLILGDLNENHDEFYRRGRGTICALMPDDPEAAAYSGFTESAPQDFLVLSAEKPPYSAYFPYALGVFYSPWNGDIENGSYFYKGEWETIDNLLLSPEFWDGGGWKYKNASALNIEPFVNSKGKPAIYNPRTGTGLSDHLPMLLVLSLE